MLTDKQQQMFDGAANSIKAHLTAYEMRVSIQEKPYQQIVVSDDKGNQLILRAI